ncbi:MAG: GFA family protein [Deltaproteobacteria bacterium]
MTTHSGHCLCGAVSFTVRDLAPAYGVCHCKMCQRWAGSALFGITVRADQIEIHGEENVASYRSSEHATRSWCSKCGSNMWFRYVGRTEYELPVGLFDDSNGFVLKREVFFERKSDAFALAGDHERLTTALLEPSAKELS